MCIRDSVQAAAEAGKEAASHIGKVKLSEVLPRPHPEMCIRDRLSQCAVEEATELMLGMLGITTYAETLSVYGTEKVFIDGDDTPYSKAFLASAYASRGIKVRCTSGTGSEALMGNAEKKSMLYLEARCLLVIKGAGVQGTQNGSVSCIGVVSSVPSCLLYTSRCV